MRGRMANRSAKSSIVLITDSAYATFDFGRILFAKFFNHIEFHVVAAFTGEAVHRVGITYGFQGLAHQYKSFFFDIDNALSWFCIRLFRVSAHRSRSRAGHIQKESDRDVAFATKFPNVESL